MEALQKSVDDLKTLLEKMSTTVSALEPLVPSVASLVALPTSVDSLQQTMKEAGDHLKSVSVAVKRIETGDRSSGSSGPQHTTEDDGILGPKPQFTYPQPPPPYPRPPPVQQRFGGPHLDTMEDDQSFLKPKMVFRLMMEPVTRYHGLIAVISTFVATTPRTTRRSGWLRCT